MPRAQALVQQLVVQLLLVPEVQARVVQRAQVVRQVLVQLPVLQRRQARQVRSRRQLAQ